LFLEITDATMLFEVDCGNRVAASADARTFRRGITPTWGRTIQIHLVPTELGQREIMETHLAGHGSR
jgi:hypothetical protein